MPAEVTDLEFRGLDGAECEAFIRAVTKHALSEGKQHDDQWMADFASTCFTQAGLRWWDGLDEKVQRSWKLLRTAMLSRFKPQPTFSGQSGEEAEAFVLMVRQKAFEAGKHWDNIWMMGFASTCLVGDAMRWHASLAEATQNDWKLFWPALLAQYPRDVLFSPQTLSTKRRGRVLVCRKDNTSLRYYLSKVLYANPEELGRVVLTMAAVQALEVEYDLATAQPQALHIPDNQIPNCDVLATGWLHGNTTRSDNWIALCGFNSNSGTGSPGTKFSGPLSTNTWKVSPTADERGLRSLSIANGLVNLLPVSHSSCLDHIWLIARPRNNEAELELFLEQV